MMKNKYYNYILVLFGLGILLGIQSCALKPDDLITANAKAGGLLSYPKPDVPYGQGSGSLKVNFNVYKGPTVKEVKVYKSFYNSTLEKWSNEVLQTTVTVGDNEADTVSKSFTLSYAELRANITVDGAALPVDEYALNIGDNWAFRMVSVIGADNREVQQSAPITSTVSGQYAGTYTTSGTFIRIGVPRTWNGITKTVKSIDANTYEVSSVGDLDGSSGTFRFVIDNNTDVVTSICCNDLLAGPFEMTPASDSKGVLKGDGKHELYLYYQYNVGTRVIIDKLVRIP